MCFDMNRHLKQYFSYIVAVSCIDGGNWSTKRNHVTFHVTNKLYQHIECTLQTRREH